MKRALGLLVAALALCSGCGLTLTDVPMPKLVSGPTYALRLEFDDALNLPVDAPVKLEGATVGQVTSVTADGYRADVEVAVSTAVHLRSTSTAEIRLTAPMGTSFVELSQGRTGGYLPAGGTIALAATGEAPDVSDLLSALSTVVTGGSFGDISTIIKQLNVALTGHTGTVRALLSRLDTAVTGLNRQLPTLDRLTGSLDRLTRRLRGDLPTITASLTDLSRLVSTLSRQRVRMIGALGALRRFELQATPFTEATRADIVGQLGSLRTVLHTLLGSSTDINGVMAGLAAFAKGSDRAAPGDFANFDLTLLLDPSALAAYENGTGGLR
ncbi:MAG TPA: MlaD family protein [Nocardioides sp.]|nr:MlaD family protein [Nocardioides sp.]